MRNASTSPSKPRRRTPTPCRYDAPPGRRRRRARAPPPRGRRTTGTGTSRTNESAVSAASATTSEARARVTRSAGPEAVGRVRLEASHHEQGEHARAGQPDDPPERAEADGGREHAEQDDLGDEPERGPARGTADRDPRSNRSHRASVPSMTSTERTRLRFSRRRAKGGDRGDRRAGLLAARAGGRRDPPGAGGRPRGRSRPGADAALRREPRHRDARLPRQGAAEPVRRHARALPGGRPPRTGEVRLPQRRRRRRRTARRCAAAPSSASTRTRPPTSCPRPR